MKKQLEKKQILVIKMTALGDVVIALPHIEIISEYHSNDSIWFLTSESSKGLLLYHPPLNITVLDRNHSFGKNGFWQKLRWIRRQNFERIYDLQGNRISRLLTRFSGSSFRVGSSPHPAYTHAPAQKWIRTTHQNCFDRFNETLVSAGLPRAESKAHMYLNSDDILTVDRWMKQQKLEDRKYIVMHAGSSSDRPAKRWPVDNYLRLAEKIEAQGLKCIWIGSDPEKKINAYLSEKIGIDSTGLFTLRQVYELARKALFAVSSDSCPMHIFAAAGIPVFCFFGPENWRWAYPLGQRDRVLTTEVECSPCFRGICPKERGHQCLSGITPESVFNKIDQEFHLLKNSGPNFSDN